MPRKNVNADLRSNEGAIWSPAHCQQLLLHLRSAWAARFGSLL